MAVGVIVSRILTSYCVVNELSRLCHSWNKSTANDMELSVVLQMMLELSWMLDDEEQSVGVGGVQVSGHMKVTPTLRPWKE